MTTILLDIFEDQLDIGRLTTIETASRLLDQQLHQLGRVALSHGGKVSHERAERHASGEYQKFAAELKAAKIAQSDSELVALKRIHKDLPKSKSKRSSGES